MVNFWAKVKSIIFNVKPLWLLFGQLLETFGLLLNLSSGHSAYNQLKLGTTYLKFQTQGNEFASDSILAIHWTNVQICHGQCDQIGRFITLWATFQGLCNNYFAQIAHILAIFCEGVEIFHFSSEIVFGQLFTGHTGHCAKLSKLSSAPNSASKFAIIYISYR